MYYEVFEELKFAEAQGLTLEPIQLYNKCLLDSFYDIRSEISPIYNEEENYSRLVGKNYPYLFYQKMVTGIAKSVFIGFNPWKMSSPVFLPSGRLRVPANALELDGKFPLLYFSGNEFSYQNSCLQKWEDEVMKISAVLNPKFNLSLTRDGFRAHINRILEVMYAMRSSAVKRRTNWTVFLSDLIINQKNFSQADLEKSGFKVEEFGDSFIVMDENFPTHDYHEFRHLQNLAELSSANFDFVSLSGSVLEQYSQLNKQVLGNIPLCQFYINEHMFIAKEVYDLQQYIDYYVYPWTKAKDVYVHYLENGTMVRKVLHIEKFRQELERLKYTIVLGFHENRDGVELMFSAEPRMLRG